MNVCIHSRSSLELPLYEESKYSKKILNIQTAKPNFLTFCCFSCLGFGLRISLFTCIKYPKMNMFFYIHSRYSLEFSGGGGGLHTQNLDGLVFAGFIGCINSQILCKNTPTNTLTMTLLQLCFHNKYSKINHDVHVCLHSRYEESKYS